VTANRVEETTSTTGTTDFTLTGATTTGKYFAFADKFAQNERFTYWADNETNSELETGIGYLDATGKLVREVVQDNHLGTAAKVNFTTAPVIHNEDNEESGDFPATLKATTGTRYQMLIPQQIILYTTSYTHRASQLYLVPFLNPFRGLVSKWALYVKTASAGAVARMAIYLVDEATGDPLSDPWMESDDIDCGTTGLVTLSFSNNVVGPTTAKKLPEKFFLALAFEDTTIAVQSINYGGTAPTWLPVDSNSAKPSLYYTWTMGTPTPATPVMPTLGALGMRGENYPFGGFQQ